MKNLDELFNKIKFSTILTTGRTGSDYLQGWHALFPRQATRFHAHIPAPGSLIPTKNAAPYGEYVVSALCGVP